MSRQYSLPDSALGAGRDLAGVRKCILDAVQKTQGYGCAPGILGVCIGGDRATAYEVAKEQLLQPIDASGESTDPALRKLERALLKDANSLGIGPMGLGGKTTLLGVRVAPLRDATRKGVEQLTRKSFSIRFSRALPIFFDSVR